MKKVTSKFCLVAASAFLTMSAMAQTDTTKVPMPDTTKVPTDTTQVPMPDPTDTTTSVSANLSNLILKTNKNVASLQSIKAGSALYGVVMGTDRELLNSKKQYTLIATKKTTA